MSADPIAAVRAILLADPAVAALVDTRIYNGEVPEDAQHEMPQAAIVLNPAGGRSNPGGGFQRYGANRVDTFCYGAKPGEAWQVYLAVYQALKQARSQIAAGLFVMSVDVLSKGALGTDPLTQWPLCLASFSVLAAEDTA